jgi:hypothetical protein
MGVLLGSFLEGYYSSNPPCGRAAAGGGGGGGHLEPSLSQNSGSSRRKRGLGEAAIIKNSSSGSRDKRGKEQHQLLNTSQMF